MGLEAAALALASVSTAVGGYGSITHDECLPMTILGISMEVIL